MRVCAVTVTYGDRWHLLKQVLESVLAAPSLAEVVIVNNGAMVDLEPMAVSMDPERIRIIDLGENLGSAAGFSRGIEAALDQGCEYIWLLDDDNVPGTGALDLLTVQYELLAENTPRDKLALQSMREGREHFRQIARGDDPMRWFPIDNSYLGFHWKRAVGKLFARGGAVEGAVVESVAIPFGVYGGLFFHRSVVAEIGLPRADLFLYVDDNEFSLRLTRSGGSLFLIPQSRLADAEKSWAASESGRRTSLASRQASASAARVYYNVRNGTWFSRKYYCRSRFVYAINKWSYLVRVALGLALRGRFDRIRLMLGAVRDGERGRLGQRPEYGL